MLIYRYRPLTKRTIEYIENRQLYFSNPLNFNDPFDCDLNCLTISESDDIDSSYSQYINLLEQRYNFIGKFITHYSVRINDNDDPVKERYYYDDVVEVYFKEIRALAEELHVLKNTPKENRKKALSESWETKKNNVINNLGVVCFSESRSNILMWSHYASDHKGVCIEYNSNERPIKFWKNFKFHKVTYQDERNIDVLSRGFTDSFYDLLTVKSPDWAYEDEHRLITIKGPGPQKQTMQSLNGIILGARIKENDKRELALFYTTLKNVDKQRRSLKKLKYYIASKDNNTFSININEASNLEELKVYLEL
ncbi:MAG: DUF2971 domain-containing protein [Candidatus Electrothrix sp. AX2]|nr:DUF2971 domain-containing protein [Candidatus Electrothrix gigas]